MLGRSARGITWMARYLERAENTARLLDAGFRMALTRGDNVAGDEWRGILVTLGQVNDYDARGAGYTGAEVINWVLRGQSNQASVLKMIENARTNARMVRTAITRDVWEATNESWILLEKALARPVREAGLGEILDLIRRQAMLVRGAIDSTMLHNDIVNFLYIGRHIERADNTARILDVKYHVLLPGLAWIGSRLDNVQWEAILRSVAGDRAFRWLNAGCLDPKGIAEFLILDGRFPSSFVFCYNQLDTHLACLARDYGFKGVSHSHLEKANARLKNTAIDNIFDSGLHEFIIDFIAANRCLADAVAADFRFTE